MADWKALAAYVRRLALWEFEDYDEKPVNRDLH